MSEVRMCNGGWIYCDGNCSLCNYTKTSHTTAWMPNSCKKMTQTFPAIDPVKHGRWEHGREIARTMLADDVLSIDYEDWHCSCCGRRYKEYVLPYNFCPNCGAQMERSEK